MVGDARVRACGDCQQNVYNLSELTRDEAEDLIRAKEGRLCVRYFQRADGTLLLKNDCAVGVKRRRHRRIAAVGVAAGLAAAALGVRAQQAHRRHRMELDYRLAMERMGWPPDTDTDRRDRRADLRAPSADPAAQRGGAQDAAAAQPARGQERPRRAADPAVGAFAPRAAQVGPRAR